MTIRKKLKTPPIRQLQKTLTAYKNDIDDDYVGIDEDKPSIDVTLACDDRGHALQTGDNSYMGAAYHYEYWAVGSLYRNSNCRELAQDLIEQCREGFDAATA